MSSEMDFKTARKKLEEGTNMNFSRWTGKMVARHLYEAGKARLQGKSYEFPGYYLFPIELYTHTKEELPFPLHDNINFGFQFHVFQQGLHEYYSMVCHYQWFRLDMVRSLHEVDRTIATPAELAAIEEERKKVLATWKAAKSEFVPLPPEVQAYDNVHHVEPRDMEAVKRGEAPPPGAHSNLAQNIIERPWAKGDQILAQNGLAVDANGFVADVQGANAIATDVPDPNPIATDVPDPNPIATDVPDLNLIAQEADEVVANAQNANGIAVEVQEANGFGDEDQAELRRNALAQFAPQQVVIQPVQDPNQEQVPAPQDAPPAEPEPVQLPDVRRPRRARRRRRRSENEDNSMVVNPIAAENIVGRLVQADAEDVPQYLVAAAYPLGESMNEEVAPMDQAAHNDIVLNAAPADDGSVQNPVFQETDNNIELPMVEHDANTLAPNDRVSNTPGMENVPVIANDANNVNQMEVDNDLNTQGAAALDENGLPRQRGTRATPQLDKAISQLGKTRQPRRKRKRSTNVVHTPDPAELIHGLLEEYNFKWIDRLGGRPDLSNYYSRIDEMVLQSAPDSVDINDYLDGIETSGQRFAALVALTDKASDGYISIERVPNGPIVSFKQA